ncbi:MAG: hypothetical protein H6851_04985 [Geminicoccaceae bacterium]|nr:hypothetical protein [Geminicoccaceae bacterium]
MIAGRFREWIAFTRPAPDTAILVATVVVAMLVLAQTLSGFVWPAAPPVEEQAATEPSPVEAEMQDEERPAALDDWWTAVEPAAGGDAAVQEADRVANPDRGLLEPRERTLDLSSTKALEDVAVDLKRRREAIEKREADMAMREETMVATRAKLDEQLDRLEKLRQEIAGMIKQVEADEEARLQQLVTVYEKMKGKDAAVIFDRLDPEVLLGVSVRMREAKLAAIMAKMNPDRARYLTTELARQKSLPVLGP